MAVTGTALTDGDRRAAPDNGARAALRVSHTKPRSTQAQVPHDPGLVLTAPGLSCTHQNHQHLKAKQRLCRAPDRTGARALRCSPPRCLTQPRARGCSESNRQRGKTPQNCSSPRDGAILEAERRISRGLSRVKPASCWLRPTA